ncbi:MAG: TIGR01440 family protein [Clostridia bacterium]|nr:TIGR01440 family protein [Clostridia bacterium]
MLNELYNQANTAAKEIIETAKLKSGNILVVGCSSSEIAGQKIGTFSNIDVAKAVFNGIYDALNEKGIYLAAQCCEHLNRAIIIEREAVINQDIVNVVPMIKAGGSFATTAYNLFNDPVSVEMIKADAGLDIGGTLIGMHLKHVAVPVRLSVKSIGQAPLLAARTRPKFIGGIRANYDENLG